ncbi:uncharacterized protein LOC124926347 isoform X2 [Impatiens glandulifera]|uniref:uncharacterized protein LOC124926347 isoform X2 n=1 Tax=Impatiens glandulifera TaxID=253017 RepID=UPI001FB171E7|nr:uncharacterized protein LOC124926347 isoform X2 [Impatiens glandulifera]
MGSAGDSHNHPPADDQIHISRFIQSTISNVSSLIFNHNPRLLLPSKTFPSSLQSNSIFDFSTHPDSLPPNPSPSSSSSSSLRGMPSDSTTSPFPSTMRISSLNPAGNGGPAFVGQVFSMCDLSGTGLMAVSTHFDIPFISNRTPEWLKKMFATVTKSERKGPVFRFFMDLGDAVTYVKKLNIPSGVVGACRLDSAFEHFQEKPHLFQFVPNERQVKEANKLLKAMPRNNRGKKKINGVPVFSAQNLDIAIATTDGIKWYTPFFFDKNMLDNILEESADQHFQSLVQTRNMQRRRDVFDDSFPSETNDQEEAGDSVWEPHEVQEVLDEVGHPEIPLSVISKAAEIHLLHAVDKLLLGNRWLRKVTGIQPKFPYLVDSFEERSTASLLRASRLSRINASSEESEDSNKQIELELEDYNSEAYQDGGKQGFQFPFGDWNTNPLSKLWQNPGGNQSNRREEQSNPLLPKITMVGIATRETGLNKAGLKKTMEDLTKELERVDEGNVAGYDGYRDPLFVANVGDYHTGVAKTGSARWARKGANQMA